MLSHEFVGKLFGFPDIKVCALLTALDCINNSVKFVSETFVLRVNWDVMFRENSSKF